MFEDAAIEALPFRRFWKHSVACAVFAHNLATLCGRKDAEKYFTAGLLHDVGRLALFTRYPEMGKVVVALEQKREMPVHAAEVSVFDVDHGVVGALFFTKWGLPRGIVKAALYHHHPGRCLGRDTAEVVFAANQIAAALGFGSNRAYDLPPGEEVWKSLGIGSEDLFSLVDNVDERLCSLLESFEGGAG
jgi:putative nucleotidyltransferase with HDIG domain